MSCTRLTRGLLILFVFGCHDNKTILNGVNRKYFVFRMGTVSSMVAVAGVAEILRPNTNQDQDGDVVFNDSSPDQLLLQCQQQLQQKDFPPAFDRGWSTPLPQHTSMSQGRKYFHSILKYLWLT